MNTHDTTILQSDNIAEELRAASHCSTHLLYKYPNKKGQLQPYIYIHTFMEIKAKYPYQYSAKKNNLFYLIYTLDGNGTLTSKQLNIDLTPQTLCFLNGNDDFQIKIRSAAWHYKIIAISGTESLFFYNAFTAAGNTIISTSAGAGFLQLLSIMENTEKYMLDHPINHIAYATRLMTTVVTMHHDLNDNKMVPSYLQQIKKTFDENYKEYFSLDILENQFHINKFKLAKDFTQYFGISPINYLNTKRIEAAKILLLTTKDHIHEIGRNVGYENTNHFINSFKKQTGVTPLNYRKNMTL